MNLNEFKWTRAPKEYTVNNDTVEIITEPFTDLWQRTTVRHPTKNKAYFLKKHLLNAKNKV